MNDGEGALELRELPPDPVAWNEPPLRRGREEEADDEPPRLPPSFLSRGFDPDGVDHSLSVAGELVASSVSPKLLLPPALVDVEPLMLREDELALMSFSFPFSFSSKPMNMRDRASL